MKISSLVYLIITILLSSCSHHYYIPNVQNVPMFTEKNEFRASVSTGGSGGNDGSIEVQTAYSITNSIGIMANYMHANEGYTISTQTEENIKVEKQDFGNVNYFEGAIGYYQPLNKNETFEIYGGYGGGHQSHQYVRNIGNDLRTGTSDVSYYRLFIQPSWGYKTQAFEIAFSTRFNRLFYNHFQFKDLYYNSEIDDSNYDLGAFINKSHFLIEPAVTMRAGFKNVKVQVQYLYSAPIDSSDKKYIIKNHFSLGLYFSFGNKTEMN